MPLRVSELRALACCDDEPIHIGMALLMRLSVSAVVFWRQEPGPGMEAEWWVSVDPQQWRMLAIQMREERRVNSGEVAGKTAEGSAEKQHHACDSLRKKEKSISTSIPFGASTSVCACASDWGDEAEETAILLLLQVGVTPGEPKKILEAMHSSLRELPPDVVVEAAICLAGRQKGVNLPGLVRRALAHGWEGKILRAGQDLFLQRRAAATPSRKQRSLKTEPLQPMCAEAPRESARVGCEVTFVAGPEAVELWGRITAHISELMEEASYREWIKPLCPVRFEAETQILLISVPSVAVHIWIEQQLQEEFGQALKEAGLQDLRLKFTINFRE